MLVINKEKLLNTTLNDGFSTVDSVGPCIKCAFLASCVDLPVHPRVLSKFNSLTDSYYGYIGINAQEDRSEDDYFVAEWRDSYPELCKLLDHYENRLKKEALNERRLKNESQGKNPYQGSAQLLADLVSELQERDLVEFTSAVVEAPICCM